MRNIPIIILAALAFASCSTLRQSQQNHSERHDSIVYALRIDSVFIHDRDSIFIRQHGDTVYADRISIRYRDRWRQRTDTVYVERSVRDSASVYVSGGRTSATGKPRRTGWKFWTGIAVGWLVLLLLNMWLTGKKK